MANGVCRQRAPLVTAIGPLGIEYVDLGDDSREA